MPISVDEYIEQLKKLTGTTTDSALAEKIGYAKQTISSWRRRGDVPFGVQYALTNRFGPDAALYSEIRHVTNSRERQVIEAVFLALLDRYRARFEPNERPDRYIKWAQAFLHAEDDIRAAIRHIGFEPEDDQGSMLEIVLALIENGKLDAVHRAMDLWLNTTEVDE